VQVKLLRVLQEKEFERVGGSKTIRVNVRIVAATNRDLDAMMKEGTFREDLYYRLNVITISLPPLRERPDDVQTLAKHFLRKYTQETSKNVKSISPEAMSLLRRHAWRGNIRELENCIERAVILCNEPVIHPKDLLLRDSAGELETVEERVAPPPMETKSRDALILEEGLTLREMERKYIQASLERNGGNQSRAAAELGIDRKTLRFKIKDAENGAVS
jgi:DNA-binding NtrC family response regulator